MSERSSRWWIERPHIKTTKPVKTQAGLDLLARNDVNKKLHPDWRCALCHSINKFSRHLNYPAGIPRGQVPPYLEFHPYHTSEEEMERAILEGCHLCTLLQDYIPTGVAFPLEVLIGCNYQDGRTSMKRSKCWMQLGRRAFREDLAVWDLAAFGPELSLWEPNEKEMELWARHDIQLSISTASDSSFDQGKRWIAECVNTHSSCNIPDSPLDLCKPRRLLDVDKSGARIRLVDTSSLDKTSSAIEYVTLSHCWGKASILRLVKENMDGLRQSIDFDDLPLTFQHAVITSRRLGFRYIWIDSLCIIQDSKSDWEQESAIMGDIYRGGVCNISAMAAVNSNAGFFVARNPLAYMPCRLGKMGKIDPVAKSKPAPSNMAGRLSTRGWVMQERAMSPRTLHFGSQGLAWECLSQGMNEKAALPEIGPKTHFTRLCIPDSASHTLANPERHLRTFYCTWSRLLASYSSCTLTVPGDRLVAFNAIIAEASRRTGLTPVAGLWKELLPADLLWYRDAPSPLPNSKQAYSAPSWSWGAISSGVKSSYAEFLKKRATLDFKVEIINVDVPAKPNGQVTDGSIRLLGPAKLLKWSGDTNSDELRENCCLDGDLDDLNGIYAVLVLRAVGDTLRLVDDRVELSTEDRGLILQRAHGTESTFRRVGIFKQKYFECSSVAAFGTDRQNEVMDFSVI
jgi:hypothetical protein